MNQTVFSQELVLKYESWKFCKRLFPMSHLLVYARIPRNRQKVRQFGVLVPIPKLAFVGNHKVKE